MTLTDHIATGETTLSYCWVVTRKDGVTLGFTDHDENVTVDGVTCVSSSGITTSKLSQSLGLDADDVEVEGVIDDDLITVADLRSGVYDNASVKIYLVNWSDPTQYDIVASGLFGNVTDTDTGAFMTEFRSKSYVLEQTEGRAYQRTCDAKLGDARCGVDLDTALYRHTTTVAVATNMSVVVTSISGYADDWFTLGKVIVNGAEVPIRRQVGTRIELWQRMSNPIASGETVTLIAGCKQDADTCRVKFNNILRFQGFPFMPGTDRLTAYPVRGQAEYEGGSLFDEE